MGERLEDAVAFGKTFAKAAWTSGPKSHPITSLVTLIGSFGVCDRSVNSSVHTCCPIAIAPVT